MTRIGPTKQAGGSDADGRLRQARDYKQAANDLLALAAEDANANPIISQIVLSAIAYADALTARLTGRINKKDHAALPALLREAAGRRLSDSQVTRLKRILAEKDTVQYGVRLKRKREAEVLCADLEKFAGWVETELSRSA